MNQCCICETKKYSKDHSLHDGYKLLKCAKCSLVYLDSAINPESFINDAKKDQGRKSRKIEYWSFPKMYDKYPFVFNKFFQERLNRCRKYNQDIKTMFDIGAGFGFWMDYCQKSNISVRGIEISQEAIDYSQDRFGLKIDKNLLEEVSFDSGYDLYNLCDVLEHIKAPNKNLQLIHKNMKPNSLLYIQVPDVLGFRIPLNHNLGLPHHIWQFNFKCLRVLLAKNGFKVIGRWQGVQGVIGAYEQKRLNIFTKLSWQIARMFNLGNRLSVLCTIK